MKTRNRILAAVLFSIACFAGSFCIEGCSTFAALKTAWSAPNRAATVKALEADALGILEPAGVSLLQSLASGNKLDGHTAASLAWSSLTVPTMTKLLDDAGVNQPLADNAAALARQAMSAKGVSSQEAINAVASAISSGALK